MLKMMFAALAVQKLERQTDVSEIITDPHTWIVIRKLENPHKRFGE